jgi:hypothetical protein
MFIIKDLLFSSRMDQMMEMVIKITEEKIEGERNG